MEILKPCIGNNFDEVYQQPAKDPKDSGKFYETGNNRTHRNISTNCVSIAKVRGVLRCISKENAVSSPVITSEDQRNCKINIHVVTQSSPSPARSYTQSVPHAAHVSHLSVANPRNKQSNSSFGGSSAIHDVHISDRLMEDFLELAKANTDNDLETCGVLGAMLKNETYYVTTLIIPKQESTSSSCQTLNEEEIHAIQHEQSLYPVGWIHTHPSQSCFMSSIDLHTHYSYQVMLPEAFAIVMAPTDTTRSYGIFRLSDPEGTSVLKECPERGFHPHKEPADGSTLYEDCSNVYVNSNLRFEIIDLR